MTLDFTDPPPQGMLHKSVRLHLLHTITCTHTGVLGSLGLNPAEVKMLQEGVKASQLLFLRIASNTVEPDVIARMAHMCTLMQASAMQHGITFTHHTCCVQLSYRTTNGPLLLLVKLDHRQLILYLLVNAVVFASCDLRWSLRSCVS